MSVTPYALGSQVTDWILSEGRQSSPQQADREIYENGAESPHSTQYMFFGFKADHGFLCKAGADDGDGMNRHDHLEYMRHIMNTGANKTTTTIGAAANKGVGARIASLAHNPEGVDVYARTPVEAKVGMPWHLVRLLPTGVYNFPVTGSSPDDIVDAEDAEVAQFPEFVRKAGHGVVVVFRGDGTVDGWTNEEWKRTFYYLQQRYYTMPLKVSVDGESIPLVAKTYSRSDYRYEITSLSKYYAKHAGHTGIVILSDGAEVEWFVFDHTAVGHKFDAIRKTGKDKGKPYGVNMESGPSRVNGFRGVGVRDGMELFNHSTPRLSTFNVIGQRATSRVSLIVTPPSGLMEPTTNRQNMVVVGGGEIPWYQWGKEFGENMPDPIKALMDQDFKSTGTISAAELDRLDPDWHKRIQAQRACFVKSDGTLEVEPTRPVVVREGSSGGVRGNGPGPHEPSPGPNPGPSDGDQDGSNAGNHHSNDGQLATPTKARTRTSTKGSELGTKYLDLHVTWLPDVDPAGGPTWSNTVVDPEAMANGWAWFPGSASTTIYLRRTGDPFQRTMVKYLGKYPTTPRTKVQSDVENAYGIEAISKVVYVQDCAAMGWTTAQIEDQFKGLCLSFAVVGLNSVEALVEQLLRKTTSAATAKPAKRVIPRSTPRSTP